MPARRNTRRIYSAAFPVNTTTLIELPRVDDVRNILIEVNGTLQIATAVATAVAADAPCGLIDSCQVVLNGKDVAVNVPFNFRVMNNYELDFSEERTAPGTTIATHPIRAVGHLDLFNMDGPRPKDSALQSYLSNLFQLRLVTRDATYIVTPGGSTVLTLVATLNVILDSLIESEDKGEPKFFKKQTSQHVNFTGANTALAFNLPYGNYIRAIEIRATDQGTPSDTLINSVQFVLNDTDVRHASEWKALRSINRHDRRGNAPATGFAVIDAAPTGTVKELYDASRATRAQLIVDHNAATAGKIEVVTTEWLLPNLPAAAAA